MRKITQILSIFLLVFLIFPVGASDWTDEEKEYWAEREEYWDWVTSIQPPVMDYAKLLTDAEEASLVQAVERLQSLNSYSYGIVLLDGDRFSGDLLQYIKTTLGPERYGNDRFIMALDLSSRQMVMEINGTARDRISDAQTDLILDAVAPHFTAGNYYDGFQLFLTMTEDRLYGRVSEAEEAMLREAEMRERLPVLGGAFLMSLLVASITTVCFVQGMNNVRDQDNATAYANMNEFRVTKDRETFLYRNVIKTPRAQSNGGGGGGGGGGRSSGGRSRGF